MSRKRKSPMSPLQRLVDVLTLEQIEVNMFRGRSPPDEVGRIFGGQVIAQALLAAYQTVQDRVCHSLQAYFIRPGDPTIPVLYEVERSRDGKSFMTRRVIAIQHGEQILNLAASFQVAEQGLEHQDPMPNVPRPESLRSEAEMFAELAQKYPERADEIRSDAERPVELRAIAPINLFDPKPAPAQHGVWMRLKGNVKGEAMNQAALAYASDMALLGTSMRPHGVSWWKGGMQTASLDHILWFHRPVKFDAWHLYAMDSPSASGARGFNRGAIYDEDGRLVASAAQEGLIRQR